MFTRLLFLAFLPCILLCASCIEGDEELWLERDGSGRIEATYRMPPAILNRMGGAASLQKRLTTAIATEPGIRVEELSHRKEGAQVVFTLRAEFDNIIDFVALPRAHLRDPAAPGTPSAEELFFGEIHLKLSGLMLEFDRSIDLASLLPRAVRENGAMLGNSEFRYVLHLPAAPSSHNATWTSDNGTTLGWTFPLRDHTRTPMELHTCLILPLPRWAWLLIGLCSLLLLAGPVRFLRRAFRRRTSPLPS